MDMEKINIVPIAKHLEVNPVTLYKLKKDNLEHYNTLLRWWEEEQDPTGYNSLLARIRETIFKADLPVTGSIKEIVTKQMIWELLKK